MVMRKWYCLGQSTTEFAVFAAVVAAALVAMNVYVKRSIQGRIKELSDQITAEDKHYSPNLTNSTYVTTQSGTTVYNYSQGVSRIYQDGSEGSTPENITRSGHEETRSY
jgi:Flp pilus assembly pilin Flp